MPKSRNRSLPNSKRVYNQITEEKTVMKKDSKGREYPIVQKSRVIHHRGGNRVKRKSI